MMALTYIAFSIVIAFLVHLGASAGPSDTASAAIEQSYVSGGWFKAIRLALVWAILLYASSTVGQCWIAALFAVPGGASLRFLILKFARSRGSRG